MATSNSYDFTVTGDTICKAALRKVAAHIHGVAPTATQLSEALEALNFLISRWRGKVIPMWNNRQAWILPQLPATYPHTNYLWPVYFGTGQCASAYVYSTLTNNEIATSSAIDITSATGFSGGMTVGVQLDDNESLIHWTTIASVASNVINLTAPLPSAASSGNMIYAYSSTNAAPRPVRIMDQFVINHATQQRWPISQFSLNELHRTQNVAPAGPPIHIGYQPNWYGQVDSGTGIVWVYPGFFTAQYVIEVLAQYPFERFSSGSDDCQLPPEWYSALVDELALKLAPEYGLERDARMLLKADAKASLEDAEMLSNEDSSIFIQPDRR